MKLLGLELRLPFTRAEKRDGGAVRQHPSGAFFAFGSATGVTVTPATAKTAAAVFACVRVISTTISTLPLKLYKRTGKNIEEATWHQLFDVVSAIPNEEMTTPDLLSAMEQNLCLQSNAFAQILRNATGQAIGLYPVPTEKVERYRDATNAGAIRYRLSGDNGTTDLPASDVLDVRVNSANGISGSPLTVEAQEAIALAIALQQNAGLFFGNGSRFNGVLEVPDQISDEGAKRLSEMFAAMTTGSNAYKVPVLEQGTKFTQTSQNNRDSQFDESRINQSLEICRLFGVPPHKIGILNSQPRANVEQDNLSFLMDTIRPRCVNYEAALNAKLLTAAERKGGLFFRFDMDELLRGDLKTRVEAYTKGIQTGVWSPNEVRQKFGENPYDGGDKYLVPVNLANAANPDKPKEEA